MSIHYFRKEQANNKLIGIGGVSVPFELLAGNTGVIRLDDSNPEEAKLASLLDKVAGRQGVVRMTEKEFDDVKKKRLSVTFAPRSSAELPPVRVFNPPTKSRPAQAPDAVSAVAAAPTADPAPEPAVDPSAPKPAFKPRLGRPPKIKAPTMPVSMAPVRQEIVRMAP